MVVCALAGFSTVKAGNVITLTAHYYPYKYGPKIYMDFKQFTLEHFFI